jgi:hypothetical protein
MTGNGSASEVSRTVDHVQELDEVIRLIHFLGKSKPGGFTAALGWAEEKLWAVREAVAEPGSVCGNFAADTTARRSHAESFPLMPDLAALYGGGNRS